MTTDERLRAFLGAIVTEAGCNNHWWLDKEASALLAALQPRSEGTTPAPATLNNWQPIETAPKDGETIIVYHAAYVSGHGVPASWDRDEEDEGGQCWRVADAISDRVTPTHWMPLPEPPSRSPGAVPEARPQETTEDDRWQSFETAPRDGTIVWVWREDAGVFAAFWSADDGCWFTEGGGEDLTGDEPTHWMPQEVPPPPHPEVAEARSPVPAPQDTDNNETV